MSNTNTNTNTNKKTCGECRHYHKSERELNIGECRRMPPVLTLAPQQTPAGPSLASITSYPVLPASFLPCGEFSAPQSAAPPLGGGVLVPKA